VALPGNQAETENTNIDLQRRKKLIYSTSPKAISIAPGEEHFLLPAPGWK